MATTPVKSFHNFPTNGKKAKASQKKQKKRQLKQNPEVLNWDYTSNDTLCDVLFYTERLEEWHELCKLHYVAQGQWESLPAGDGVQLRMLDQFTLNFYNSGIIMAQGKCFVHWGQHDFPKLKNKLIGSC